MSVVQMPSGRLDRCDITRATVRKTMLSCFLYTLFLILGLGAGEENLLEAHNAFRFMFGRRPLRWSVDLEARARDWAEALSISSGELSHDRQGQNIAWSGGSLWPAFKALCHWTKSPGHRATLMSEEIDEVGCGVARTARGTFVVCNYSPVPASTGVDPRHICPNVFRVGTTAFF